MVDSKYQALCLQLPPQSPLKVINLNSLNLLYKTVFNPCSNFLADSDVPESLLSPTDEETCSYVSVTEEEFCAVGSDNISCSDYENLPVSVTVEDAQPALRFSAFPDIPPVIICFNLTLLLY